MDWGGGMYRGGGGGRGYFPSSPQQRGGYYGDEFAFRGPPRPPMPRGPLRPPPMPRQEFHGYFNEAPRYPVRRHPAPVGNVPPVPPRLSGMMFNDRQRPLMAAPRPRPVPVPPPPSQSGQVVYQVNQSKSLPAEIQNILVTASRAGNLNAAEGFKLREYYETLTDNVKITFYQHMVKCLGVGDADLIAGRPALIAPKESPRPVFQPPLPTEVPRMPPYSGDYGDDVDIDMTVPSNAGLTPNDSSNSSSSIRPHMPLIVPTKIHVVDRNTKALERRRRQVRATPKVHHDNVMDYKKEELPGVRPNKEGKFVFNPDTVRWIRQMLYILHRSNKGGDKGADAFLKQMEDYFGPDIVKQVNEGKQMWRLKQAEENAAREALVPNTPEEAAKLAKIKELRHTMHHLKLSTVVGLTGQETRCGLTPETIAWIRENVLAMMEVQMNPDKFLWRIGGMFGYPAMNCCWADKSFAETMLSLLPGMPDDDKPVKLLRLASKAYKLAFKTILPGMESETEEDKGNNKECVKLPQKSPVRPAVRTRRFAKLDEPSPLRSSVLPFPAPMHVMPRASASMAFQARPPRPMYRPGPPEPGPLLRVPLQYDDYDYSRMPVESALIPLSSAEFRFRPKTISRGRPPYPSHSASATAARAAIARARVHVTRGKGGRPLK